MNAERAYLMVQEFQVANGYKVPDQKTALELKDALTHLFEENAQCYIDRIRIGPDTQMA